MRNYIILITEMLLCYVFITILYKKYKTDGLLSYSVTATIISTILSKQEIDILNTEVPLGMGITISLVIVANIITQNRGKDEVNNLLLLVLVTSLTSYCFLSLSGMINPSMINEYANKSYDSIFQYNIRLYLANTISLLLSIYLSSRIYYSLKRIKNKIIISNVFSILIVEFVDNIIFIVISYLYIKEIPQIILALVLRYMIKTAMGLIGTIPIYIIKKIK